MSRSRMVVCGAGGWSWKLLAALPVVVKRPVAGQVLEIT